MMGRMACSRSCTRLEMNEIVYVFSFNFAYFKPRAIYDSFPQCVFSDEEQSRFPSSCIVCDILQISPNYLEAISFSNIKALGHFKFSSFERYVDCA